MMVTVAQRGGIPCTHYAFEGEDQSTISVPRSSTNRSSRLSESKPLAPRRQGRYRQSHWEIPVQRRTIHEALHFVGVFVGVAVCERRGSRPGLQSVAFEKTGRR